jgi:hypothetical protein
MDLRYGLIVMILLVVAACGEATRPPVLASPYGDGIEHTEPVFFTGKHYNVTFKYVAAQASYEMRVEGDGHVLGPRPGDQKTAEQVASSALSHFGCPTKHRARIVAGSVSPVAGAWILQARCG